MRSAVGAVAAIAVLLGISAMAAGASGTDRAERPSTESSSLSSAEAVVLGIVEGVTEYLPVSSTGHLLITERLMGIGTSGDADKNAADSYTIAIQIGAIVAVLGIYRRRFVTMIDGVLGRSDEGRSVLMSLLAAFVPAAIIGQIFGDAIKDRLLSPWPVAAAWLVGGVGILIFVGLQSRLTTSITSLAQITPRHALIIGVAQTVAMWPGVSRSLVTIIAALLMGVAMDVAVEFSFLLGFITLSAATVYDLAKHGNEILDQFGVATPLLGIVVAGVAAFASVKFMISWLSQRGLALFGWYRIAAGIAAGVMILAGTI